MSPETATGLAALGIFLFGGFIGYLFGKGRINIKTKLLKKNVAEAKAYLDYCMDGAEEEVKRLIERIKKYLEDK